MEQPPSTSQAITKRPISKKAHTIDMVSLAEAYTFALMDEALCPGQGKFEEKLKAYEIRNDWPLLNHPPADWDVIEALSPTISRPMATSTPAASISEYDDIDVDSNGPVQSIAPIPATIIVRKRRAQGSTPALQAESAPGASISSTGASFSPSSDAPSPLHTRNDSRFKDDKFVTQVIRHTSTNSPILTIVKKKKN